MTSLSQPAPGPASSGHVVVERPPPGPARGPYAAPAWVVLSVGVLVLLAAAAYLVWRLRRTRLS